MKEYKLIIFDLDGTLADTSPGIYQCHRYANLKMRGNIRSDEELQGIIGGPLLKTYTDRFGYNEEDARKAVKLYREHYAANGTKGTVLYPDMLDLLKFLKQSGYYTAVATLKSERLAKNMLAEIGAAQYLDLIHGMDENDTFTKSSLINMCIQELECSPQESVLVGDSEHDAKGALETGVDFIAVTYGFGFKKKQPIDYPCVSVCDTVYDIKMFLSK